MLLILPGRADKQGQRAGSRQKTGKGQAGLEVMAYIAFLLLAFAAAYFVITSKTLYAVDEQAHVAARSIADHTASEINTAVAEGSGYSKTFQLPDNIQGVNYTILVENGIVFVEWPGKSIVSYTVVNSTTGNFTGGWNTIENRGGIIFANQN